MVPGGNYGRWAETYCGTRADRGADGEAALEGVAGAGGLPRFDAGGFAGGDGAACVGREVRFWAGEPGAHSGIEENLWPGFGFAGEPPAGGGWGWENGR